MRPFKINTSGDYVQLIYVDAVGESVQQELKSDTDAFECSYDSDGKLFLQFGAMRFENPDPTDFEIDGSEVTDAADFITKISALFTGGGGGNTIYTGDGSLNGERTIDQNGNDIYWVNGNFSIGAESAGEYLFRIRDDNIDEDLLYFDTDQHVTALFAKGGDGGVTTITMSGPQADANIDINSIDGIGQSELSIISNAGDGYNFNLRSTDGNNEVSVLGDAVANTITFTGALILPTVDPGISGALWNNAGTPAISTG